jgi:predicted aspartyl protease
MTALVRLLLFTGLAIVRLRAESKPDFAGMWKVSDSRSSTVYVIEQNDGQLRIAMFIEDSLGARILDFKGPVDGQPHEQALNGSAGSFRAAWEGDAIGFETWRDTSDGVRHIRRVMNLSADGKTIAVQWTRISPLPEESGTETWQKQDPKPGDQNLFAARDLLEKVHGPSAEVNVAWGMLATAFNDTVRAERVLVPLIRKNKSSQTAKDARQALIELYSRNSQVKKAVAQCDPDGCDLLRQLRHYPELSVAHRGYARVQATRKPDGKILLPVIAAGKKAKYQVDTGSSISLLQLSEASRLGLKLEPVTLSVGDIAGAHHDSYLAIVRTLSVGNMRLRNATFWVVPDAHLDVPGLLGIDILLKFETLRWNSSDVFEVGFAPARRDMGKANLIFSDDVPLVEVSSNGKEDLSFVLDTGMTASYFFPSFAARFLDLMVARGRQAVFELTGEAGESKLKELSLPDLQLRMGAMDLRIQSADVLLERAPLWDERNYGLIGIDLLNLAHTVTIDFQAMRLTLE